MSAIKWIINHKDIYNIRVINLSIGTPEKENDPLVKAVNLAWDSGIVVAAAAGNRGPLLMSVTSPGTSDKIITVGASENNNIIRIDENSIVDFSGRGPTQNYIIKPDVIAPGANIMSTDGVNGNNYYMEQSGTSMSTSIISGAIALLLQKNPSLSPNEVKRYIKNSSRRLNYSVYQQGWGIIDIEKLIHYSE